MKFKDFVLNEDALADKASKSGISKGTLKKVYDRGVAAWKTGHRPGTTPQQWGHARVNAFIVKKKKGGLNHDKDLASESVATDYINKDRDAHEPSYRKKNSMSDLKKASSKAAKKGVGGDVAVGRAQKSQQKRRLAKGQPLNKRPPLPEGN